MENGNIPEKWKKTNCVSQREVGRFKVIIREISDNFGRIIHHGNETNYIDEHDKQHLHMYSCSCEEYRAIRPVGQPVAFLRGKSADSNLSSEKSAIILVESFIIESNSAADVVIIE